MKQDYIKLEDLKDGWLYRIRARNAGLGIYIESTKSFLISRWKFDRNYLFEEYSTALPKEEIEMCPIPIERTFGAEKYKNYYKLLWYLNSKQMELDKENIKVALNAFNKILSLDPGLWQTSKDIARDAIRDIIVGGS